MKKKYMHLKDLNEHLLKQLENGQQELDRLNMKRHELDEVMSHFLSDARPLCWVSIVLCANNNGNNKVIKS